MLRIENIYPLFRKINSIRDNLSGISVEKLSAFVKDNYQKIRRRESIKPSLEVYRMYGLENMINECPTLISAAAFKIVEKKKRKKICL